MQPRDVTRVLWGFASLGYRPERLLLTIRPNWTWREAKATTTAAEGSRASFSDVRKRKGNTRVAISGGGEGRGSGEEAKAAQEVISRGRALASRSGRACMLCSAEMEG